MNIISPQVQYYLLLVSIYLLTVYTHKAARSMDSLTTFVAKPAFTYITLYHLPIASLWHLAVTLFLSASDHPCCCNRKWCQLHLCKMRGHMHPQLYLSKFQLGHIIPPCSMVGSCNAVEATVYSSTVCC